MTKMDADWQAKWIWNTGEESPRNEWWCFRKTFQVDGGQERGSEGHIVRITADSRYVLYVNGEQVGRGPVRSWPFELAYDEYEVGHLLKPGQPNVIAVLVIHFGVSNFYYLRGRGGLLVQIEAAADGKRDVILATDSTWRVARHAGQQSRTSRMSCQTGFAEITDARNWNDEWTHPAFNDDSWNDAAEIGPVGTKPWDSLIPRDIPYLTEEPYYPVRIESLSAVQPIAYTTSLDLRNQFVPGSEEHANSVQFCGYVATVIRMKRKGPATLGFVESVKGCSVNGRWIGSEEFAGVQPEQYAQVELSEGDNFVLLDVAGWSHGHAFHFGVDSDIPFELVSPVTDGAVAAGESNIALNGDESAFISIGAFDYKVNIDHQQQGEVDMEHPAYLEARNIGSASALEPFHKWIRPFPLALVSETDVFALSVWKKQVKQQPVPHKLQHAIIAGPAAGTVPAYPDADTEMIIDFGKELSGYIAFEVEASAGTIIDFYGFEYMFDGWRQDTYWLDNTLRYVCRDGRQVYTSPVRRGFRYLMVTVRNAQKPLRIYNVRMLQSNYPIAEIGRFQCSDPLLNQIWEISKHTTRLCMEDTFVDCPAYEQTFWVGDSRNEALVNYYMFAADEIVERCLRLVPGSRFQTPLYADQVPSGWSSVIPNWTFFWAIACTELYHYNGNKAFAEQIFPHVKFTLDHYWELIDENGLLNMKGWNMLDWAPIDQPNDGIVTHQNLILVKALHHAAQLASAAGERDAGLLILERANRLKEAINAHLWSEERSAYLDCIHADGRASDNFSMQTQVVAYLCGVAGEEQTRIIEGYIKSPPRSFVQIGSPFMSFFYYEALVKLGWYDVMLDDIRLNYGQMIDYDASTCWEMYPNFAENRANPNMLTRSHCHAWSAAPGYFLGANILGVRGLDPGWNKVIVEPQPAGLAWARGSVPLPGKGRVDIDWRVDESSRTMRLKVTAPRGIELEIVTPSSYEANVERVELG